MSALPRRPRVLVIAYACEPGIGSESGAGWGLVRAVSEFADCVVLAGPMHTAGIRRWEQEHQGDGMTFVIAPDTRWPAPERRHRLIWFLTYLLWLRNAGPLSRRLHAEHAFDAVYHATYSTYWLPTPAARLGVPLVWGPVGGAVRTPVRLWPALGWRGVVTEVLDFIAVRAFARLPATRRTWQKAAVRIAQNDATRARLPAPLRAATRVMNHALFSEMPAAGHGPRGHQLLFVGALEARKGARLAVRALAHTPPDIGLVIVGDGPERPTLERLARRLQVRERVEFRGRVPREALFDLLSQAAAAVFTGLREEGGLALAEAMLCGVPVIVLANGGAQTIAAGATDPSRVALIQPGTIAATVRRLADAMTRFSRQPSRASGPTLDQERARELLRDAFAEALPALLGATRERAVEARHSAR